MREAESLVLDLKIWLIFLTGNMGISDTAVLGSTMCVEVWYCYCYCLVIIMRCVIFSRRSYELC
jgi:hypothetical protein